MTWLKKLRSVNALIVSFVVAGILIGVLVAAQFQSSVAANSYLVDELNVQKDLLNSFDEDRVALKSTISNLHDKIEENRKNLAITSSDTNLERLDKLKDRIGLNKLRGKGLKIIIGEGPSKKADYDGNLIHASDLRDLVNLLRTAKVDGISINGQRLVASSTINSLGSNIMINKVKSSAPFEINVVGDVALIVDRINDQKAYPDLYKRIKNKEVTFDLQKLDQVILPAYDGDYLFKYAQKN